jgi:magnesium transporter
MKASAYAPAHELAMDHAIRDVPITSPDSPKAEILELLMAKRYASATHIAVCRDGIYLGCIRIEDLLPSGPDAPASRLMEPDPLKAIHGMDQEVAAWTAVRERKTAVAVVDHDGTFLGFIPPLNLLQILHQEHEEDLARLGGYLHTTEQARSSALESVIKRFGHRLPWLLLGLLGAMFSADIIGRFEGVLKEHILLAFFIPAIVYLADAVGTQTETVIVRGLSVGVGLKQVVLRELLTGLVIGLAISAVAFPLLLWRWERTDVAMGISLSIFAACSTASATAMAIPWALSRMGLDPAFGSGPLATVIQDLLSILIYFLIATRVI